MKVGIISVYPPPKSKHSKQTGVASYSKNLVDSLQKLCPVVVFADNLKDSTNEKDLDSENSPSLTVRRCWSRGIKYPFRIFKAVVNDDVDVVHIQHETYLFGGLFSAFAFPVLLAMLKLARKPVIVTLHGVIPLSRIDRVFLKENQINGNPILMKYGLSLLVKTIVSISNAIIVHEGALKEVLVKEYKCSFTKVHVIHHGIEEPKALVSAEEAKRKLGTSSRKVILFFGYITGYKHLELLIESARFINVSNWVMMIAGGSHPRLSEDPDYIKYLTDLKTEASQISKNILFEGFVSEPDIPTYFSSADVVVFPYNILISSSGPLSLAVSYRRPFLVSASFRDTVNYNEIVFGNNPKELADKLNLFFKDPQYNFRVTKFADEFRLNRSWKKISQQTFTLYEESKKIASESD